MAVASTAAVGCWLSSRKKQLSDIVDLDNKKIYSSAIFFFEV